MKRIFSLAMAAAVVFGLASCSKDHTIETGGGEIAAGLQFSVKTQKGNLVTRAIADGEEWTISDVEIYVFDSNGDRIGTTADFDVNGTSYTAKNDFVIDHAAETIDVYFVGNPTANKFTKTSQIDASITTKAAFIEQVTASQTVTAGKAELLQTPLLFSANAQAVVPTVGKTQVDVKLKRREARFDIQYGDGTLPVPATFVVKQVIVKDASIEGYIFADATGNVAMTKSDLADITTIPAFGTDGLSKSVFYMYPTQLGAGNTTINILVELNGTETLFEVKSNAVIEANKRYKMVFNPAALQFNIVAADYDEADDELPVAGSRPGLLSFTAGTGTGHLTRNSYELVAGQNATLRVTAGASSAQGFDVTVSGTAGIVDATAIAATQNVGAITYSTAYYPVTFDLETVYAASVIGTEVIVTFTDKANANNVASVMLYDGIDASKVLAESNSYMVTPGSGLIYIPISRAYKFWNDNTNFANADDLATDAKFEANFLWTDVAEGMASGGAVANAYVKGAGENAVLVVEPGTEEGNAVVAVNVAGETKWSWHVWNTEYDPTTGNYTYTSTGTKSASAPDAGSAHTFMDRNLGAMSCTPGDAMSQGLLYQWGRKDPFIGKNAWENNTTETPIYDADGVQVNITKIAAQDTPNAGNPNTLTYALGNPTTFIYGAENLSAIYRDWYTTINDRAAQNHYLWATIDGSDNAVKAIFDPCPEGWRVAANGTHDGLVQTTGNAYSFPWSDTAKGRFGVAANPLPTNITAGVNATVGYYPASGARSNASGNFANVGTFGYNWSSTAVITNGYGFYLYAGATGLFTNGNASRASGFPVRCIKE